MGKYGETSKHWCFSGVINVENWDFASGDVPLVRLLNVLAWLQNVCTCNSFLLNVHFIGHVGIGNLKSRGIWQVWQFYDQNVLESRVRESSLTCLMKHWRAESLEWGVDLTKPFFCWYSPCARAKEQTHPSPEPGEDLRAWHHVSDTWWTYYFVIDHIPSVLFSVHRWQLPMITPNYQTLSTIVYLNPEGKLPLYIGPHKLWWMRFDK